LRDARPRLMSRPRLRKSNMAIVIGEILARARDVPDTLR
jgi:hypothetical protein